MFFPSEDTVTMAAAITAAAVSIVAAIGGLAAAIRATSTAKKAEVKSDLIAESQKAIHILVNSQMSEAKNEIVGLKGEILWLKSHISGLTNDRVDAGKAQAAAEELVKRVQSKIDTSTLPTASQPPQSAQ